MRDPDLRLRDTLLRATLAVEELEIYMGKMYTIDDFYADMGEGKVDMGGFGVALNGKTPVDLGKDHNGRTISWVYPNNYLYVLKSEVSHVYWFNASKNHNGAVV